MSSLMLGFVLLLLSVAVVSLLVFHARPRTLIEQMASGEIEPVALHTPALAGAAGTGVERADRG